MMVVTRVGESTVRQAIWVLAFSAIACAAAPAFAQGYRAIHRDVDVTGSLGGRAPWQAPYEYDSGSDNDRRPELPYYQQGRGQQTGGPTRNLLPGDGLHIVPR
jgi:hypothetical protein